MSHCPDVPYRTLKPEEREKIRERLKAEKPPDDIEDLKRHLVEAWRERDDWKWAYQLTEGILKSDRKWHGVNERFKDQTPIVAAKLAKELMGMKQARPENRSVPPLVIPDYYRDLIDWLKEKPQRTVHWDGRTWKIRDQALSRETNTASIDDLLRSEAWVKFRKGL